jgi:hypothetical protein
LISSSCSARCTFCIKRRLSVPLLIVAVMTRREVKGATSAQRSRQRRHKAVPRDLRIQTITCSTIHVSKRRTQNKVGQLVSLHAYGELLPSFFVGRLKTRPDAPIELSFSLQDDILSPRRCCQS